MHIAFFTYTRTWEYLRIFSKYLPGKYSLPGKNRTSAHFVIHPRMYFRYVFFCEYRCILNTKKHGIQYACA